MSENLKLDAKYCFAKALHALMKERDFDDISITDICKAAGYSRVTFYRYFDSKEDALMDYAHRVIRDFQDKRTFHRGNYYAGSCADLFRVCDKESDGLMMLHKAKLDYLMLEVIYDSFHVTIPESNDITTEYSRAFMAGAFFSVIYQWLLSGKKESPDKMGEIMAACVENATIY